MAYDMYAPALWLAHTALCNLPKTEPCCKENGDVVAHVFFCAPSRNSEWSTSEVPQRCADQSWLRFVGTFDHVH